jgi:hypothetical protein
MQTVYALPCLPSPNLLGTILRTIRKFKNPMPSTPKVSFICHTNDSLIEKKTIVFDIDETLVLAA